MIDEAKVMNQSDLINFLNHTHQMIRTFKEHPGIGYMGNATVTQGQMDK